MMTMTCPPARIAVRRLAQIRMASTASAVSGLRSVLIVGAARTPVGSFQGSLAKVPATDLGITAFKGALEQANVQPDQVEEVYLGSVLQANLGQAPTRQVVLGSGCPPSTEATTINKVCASGMKAVMLAAQNIQTGERDLMVAGGMESMRWGGHFAGVGEWRVGALNPPPPSFLSDYSMAPFYYPRTPGTFGHLQAQDAIVKDGLTDVYGGYAMGICAEDTATKMDISRQAQDEYCLESYRRAAEAWKKGAFSAEVVPVTIKDRRKGEIVISEDEEYKNIKLDKVAGLKPVFKKDGTVTAANASTLNDGASAIVLASQDKVDQLGLKPLARIIAFADAACAPIDFPIAPFHAIPLALKKANLSKDDIAKWEINEAFSAVAIANQKKMDLDPTKLNVHGGAVALGHALGSSGSRIIVTLTHLLKEGEYGCAAVCNGGGGASAIIIQRV